VKGKIDHVGVIVTDLEGARCLLEEVIGLELKREYHSPDDLLDTAFFGFASGPDGGTLVELVRLHDPEVRAQRLGGDGPARVEHIALGR
jgi:catechol 2,3-dioxygenase-like lactoylglutathione lyase family enzyme